jgi:Tfp pilus assembly protein PilX
MRMMYSTSQRIGQPGRRVLAGTRRQAGAATLVVAVIMLMAVSVLVFHSHAASWLEQRATANQTRAKQAHAAAEAGLEVALSVLNADTGAPGRTTQLAPAPTAAGRFTITNATLTGSPGGELTYSVTLSMLASDTAPLARLQLTSSGGSDCSNVADLSTCSGRAVVAQVVELTSILRSPPTVAITNPAAFQSLFGASQAAIKALTTPVSSGASFGTSTSGLVWYEGNLTLSGGVGSTASPVLLVVEGNVTLPAGVAVQGFVYVTGDVNCTDCSSPSIRGAIAVAGTHNLSASNVEFPADTANGPLARVRTTAPRFAKVIGTWRDW